MTGKIKTKLALTGSLILFLLQVQSSEAARLSHIRIGEHETFARIVFEMDGSTRFEEPSITGTGEFAVVFRNTATELPAQILCETAESVDMIKFIRQGSHLTARISVPFSHFKVKSFSLSDPERVVLDIYRNRGATKNPPLYSQALALQKQGRFHEAKELYEAVLERSPRLVSALNNLGAIYIDEGQFAAARKELEKAIRIEPGYAYPYYNLACLYAIRHNAARSLSYLKISVCLNEAVRDWARTDRNLENLHGHPEYTKIIKGTAP